MKIHNLSSENIVETILQLGDLCHREDDAQKVLNLLVQNIAEIMHTDVCSLYLLDASTRELALKATYGLNPNSINQVRMKIGEGLVGKTLEWLKPISLASGKRSKQFKYFPETGEAKFSSFLSVPLIERGSPLGVLVVQNERPTRFSRRSVHLLMTLAMPSLQVIEKTRLLDTFGRIDARGPGGRLGDLKEKENGTQKRQGLMHLAIGASPGIVIARVRVIRRDAYSFKAPQEVSSFNKLSEKEQALQAIEAVEKEILKNQKKAESRLGMEEAAIFDAYRLVLESGSFKKEILSEIESGKTALRSLEMVVSRYTEELNQVQDEYIRERAYDIQDMGRKVMDRLLYGDSVPQEKSQLVEEGIFLSDFWSISDFVDMDIRKIKGILSPSGGASSHIAILAESMGIPAVLGLGLFSDNIRDDDLIIMDGSSGVVIINPDEQTVDAYLRESHVDEEALARYRQMASKKACPEGGKRISVGGNIGMLAHARMTLDNGGEEIGLYRTEFPFLIRRSLPTEEEQFELYKRVLEMMGKKPVTIRTLDIGGDKYLPYLNLPREDNPFLGWRSIRISLERKDLFRIQLRAMLRASSFGKLRILFPMISSVEEIRQVKEIILSVKKELKEEGIKIASDIPIGMMIEVPASVEIAPFLIREVNFFSIGTNDLIQYTLAVDRNNLKVANLYSPLHPAVLRFIKRIVDVAHKAKKPVSVCGEMAGQPLGVPLLVGMGVDSLSMSAPLIAKTKALISRLSYPEARQLTKQVLTMDTTQKIKQTVEDFLKHHQLTEFLPHFLS